jgi:hypothetical protein
MEGHRRKYRLLAAKDHVQPYAGDFCEQMFTGEGRLNKHRNSHRKSFKCTTCEKVGSGVLFVFEQQVSDFTI